jgi:DNA-binding NarL/FixJ family response regulator
MLSDKFRELAAAKAKVARLENAISSELNGELAALPARYGYSDVGAFVRAVKSASGGRRGRRAGMLKALKSSPGTRRRRRAVITDAIRGKVKTLVEAGKKGPEIARTLKISGQTVHNIKKSLGLVKPRT